MKCKVKCEYLKIQKLHHNDGNETITYKCNNPKSNRFETQMQYVIYALRKQKKQTDF